MVEISFEELFLVPEMHNAKIVAGVGGLHKGIHWCDILEMSAPWNYLNPGELVFLSGSGLKSIKEDLEHLIEEMDNKSSVGLVVQKGEYIIEIPSSVKTSANQRNIPIIEIPYETSVVNLTYHICRNIFIKEQSDMSMDRVLKEVMYMDYTDTMEEKAKFFGYSPSHTYVTAAVEPDDNYVDEACFEKITYYFKFYFEQHGKKLLCMQEENTITFMLPLEQGQEYKSFLRDNIDKIRKQLREVNNLTINVGIGCSFHQMSKFKRSAIESKEALKMLHACKRNDDVRMYDEMGIYRILFRVKDIRELERILQGTLGPLIENDIETDGDLVNTLETYLAEGCNISKTAEVLFIHRNTVKYKIGKIQAILNCDLKDVQTCFNLRLNYKIKRFLFR